MGKEKTSLQKVASVVLVHQDIPAREPGKQDSLAATRVVCSGPVHRTLEKYPRILGEAGNSWAEKCQLATNLAPEGQGSAWSRGAGREQL